MVTNKSRSLYLDMPRRVYRRWEKAPTRYILLAHRLRQHSSECHQHRDIPHANRGQAMVHLCWWCCMHSIGMSVPDVDPSDSSDDHRASNWQNKR